MSDDLHQVTEQFVEALDRLERQSELDDIVARDGAISRFWAPFDPAQLPLGA